MNSVKDRINFMFITDYFIITVNVFLGDSPNS